MQQDQNFNINIDPETVKGSYSNMVMITHSPAEFVLDFAKNLPGMPQPQVVSRLILTPDHAKRFLAALRENVSKYEAQFGEIKIPKEMFAVPVKGAKA